MYLYTVIIFAATVLSANCQTYRAGIVLYKPVENSVQTADVLLKANVNITSALMKSLKDQVDIFVLPEYGLTNIPGPGKKLYSYSTAIGEVGDKICGNNSLDEQLVALACAANESNAYVIANLIESVNKDTEYYLSTVGFDKTGSIVVKCRKQHLANNTRFQKPVDQQPCTFTAAINRDMVKFTILFGMDVVYPIPDTIKSGNLIMTSSISNQLPLEFGLSLYQGFAISNGANLLVSDFTNLQNNIGGSGIFYSNGTSVVAFNPEDVPGGNTSESVLIGRVPVNPALEKVVNVKAVSVGPAPTLNVPFMNIETLNESNKVLDKCIDKRCCHFRADTGANTIAPYKWIALLNTTILDQHTNSLVCALALPSSSIPNALTFKNISISTNIDKSEVLLSIPIGLNDKFLPSSFVYNAESHSIISISSDKIIVLGLIEVLGGTPSPSGGGGGNTALIVVIVLLVLALVGLLVAYIVWRKRQEKNRRNF